MNDEKTQTFPRCGECGGEVLLRTGAARTREVLRGVYTIIPEDFRIPTCGECGETMMIPEVSAVLDALLREQIAPELRGTFDELRFDTSLGAERMRLDAEDMLSRGKP